MNKKKYDSQKKMITPVGILLLFDNAFVLSIKSVMKFFQTFFDLFILFFQI